MKGNDVASAAANLGDARATDRYGTTTLFAAFIAAAATTRWRPDR
jgi:hypothetical protein